MPYKCMICQREFEELLDDPYDPRAIVRGVIRCPDHARKHIAAMEKARAYYLATKRRSFVNKSRRGR